MEPDFFAAYTRGLAEKGFDLAGRRISKSISMTVTREDPERVWARNREFYARRWGFYQEIRTALGDPPLVPGLGIAEREPFRSHELIGSPDAVLSTLSDALHGTPVTDLIYSGLASGIPRAEGQESLELFAAEVMPTVRSW